MVSKGNHSQLAFFRNTTIYSDRYNIYIYTVYIHIYSIYDCSKTNVIIILIFVVGTMNKSGYIREIFIQIELAFGNLIYIYVYSTRKIRPYHRHAISRRGYLILSSVIIFLYDIFYFNDQYGQ